MLLRDEVGGPNQVLAHLLRRLHFGILAPDHTDVVHLRNSIGVVPEVLTDHLIGRVLVHFASGLNCEVAGIAIVATRFVISDTDPETIAVLRFGIGALCLTPFLLVGFIRSPIAKADWPKVVLLGIFWIFHLL